MPHPLKIATTLCLLLALLPGCKKASSAADAGPAAHPHAAVDAGEAPVDVAAMIPSSTQEFVSDLDVIAPRVGARRIFLRVSQLRTVRNPIFEKDDQHVLVVAAAGPKKGIWRLRRDGSAPAELAVEYPPFAPREKETPLNRKNWHFGSIRLFPDGEHLLIDGVNQNPRQRHRNVMGIASIKTGKLHALAAEGATSVRGPDVHSDGKTIVFADCTKIRVGQLQTLADEKLTSEVILEVPSAHYERKTTCPVHRPRFSPDGQTIIFELVAHFTTEEFQKQHQVPPRENPADFRQNIWVVGRDGKGLRRFLSDEAIEAVGGRHQPGGIREAEYFKDGSGVVFTAGPSVVWASSDGKKARILVAKSVSGGKGRIEAAFKEEDPSVSWDGKTIIAASRIHARDYKAPPALSVIDFEKLKGMEGGTSEGSP
jgi:Tol biopolymer transport system component